MYKSLIIFFLYSLTIIANENEREHAETLTHYHTKRMAIKEGSFSFDETIMAQAHLYTQNINEAKRLTEIAFICFDSMTRNIRQYPSLRNKIWPTTITSSQFLLAWSRSICMTIYQGPLIDAALKCCELASCFITKPLNQLITAPPSQKENWNDFAPWLEDAPREKWERIIAMINDGCKPNNPYLGYSFDTQVALSCIGEYYQRALEEKGIKIADWNCRNGFLLCLASQLADGNKPLQIVAVDDVKGNVEATQEQWRKLGDNVPSKVTFGTMTKAIEDFPRTKTFGPSSHATFDVISCLNIVHCPLEPNPTKLLFEQAFNLLKPGGHFVVSCNNIQLDNIQLDETSVDNLSSPSATHYKKKNRRLAPPIPPTKKELRFICRVIDLKNLVDCLALCGFEIELQKTSTFNDPLGTAFLPQVPLESTAEFVLSKPSSNHVIIARKPS